MKKLIALLGLSLCCLYIAFGQTKEARFDENKLLERVKILSSDAFEGRKTGERGSDSARAYIINEFKLLQVPGFKGNYEQPFTFKRFKTEYKGVNILAEIKGTEKPETYIIVTAHYDHLGIWNGKIFNGADDDASGVSALISFAEYLTKNPPKHSILLIAFDAEELGLKGAKHFVQNFNKDNILLNINMDMISRSEANELYVVGARYTKSLKSIIDSFNNTTSTKLLQGHDGSDGKQDWTNASDHAPFHNAKIPFLYFGNEDHSAYHQPSDDFEDITPKFYKNATNIILSILLTIDSQGI